MSEPLRCIDPNALIVGWDFSTTAVKCLAFDLHGRVVAESRLPTDLWTTDGVHELNLMQLEGQARASVRELAARLRDSNRLEHLVAGGISATHHSAGRIDRHHNQVRRAICWNDQSLKPFYDLGLKRLGGEMKVRELIGGPWAMRYSLSHLVKDEATLSKEDWERTLRILPHGPLAGGYLTGRFDVASISAAASTGIMDLGSNQWARGMLDAIENTQYRELAWAQLPRIVDGHEPLGPISDHLALEVGIQPDQRPLIYPNLDDQAAGLIGGGAIDAGQVAIILGTSAVVNSSAQASTSSGTLDVMKLNRDRYLWMRCYNNGAQFLDTIVGRNPNWEKLEREASEVPAGCDGISLLPFVFPEPSRGVTKPRLEWSPEEPSHEGVRFRASLEALSYLIALAVQEHIDAGQNITEVTVSGGIAKSNLMLSILASVLDRPLKRLQSTEGPALGAAVVALAAHESRLREQQAVKEPFAIADAVKVLVQYGEPAQPVAAWKDAYRDGLRKFRDRLG